MRPKQRYRIEPIGKMAGIKRSHRAANDRGDQSAPMPASSSSTLVASSYRGWRLPHFERVEVRLATLDLGAFGAAKIVGNQAALRFDHEVQPLTLFGIDQGFLTNLGSFELTHDFTLFA